MDGKKVKTEAYKAAQARYDKERCTRVYLKLVKTADADILARLEAVPSKQGYIKRLIRQDIQKSSGE